MGNGKTESIIMEHFHLIYTPKGLSELSEDALRMHNKYCVNAEIGAGGLHFHCYIETEYSKDTVSDTLKKVQRVPPAGRGKRALHYSNRVVARAPPGHPDQDLRKFTLGYVQKMGNQIYVKGYTEIELKEAADYYQSQRAPPGRSPESPGAPLGNAGEAGAVRFPKETEPKDTLQDVYDTFEIEMFKGIQRTVDNKLIPGQDLKRFKRKAWNYWANTGKLFPVQATQKRFLQTLWAAYLKRSGQEVDIDEVKENLNY